MSVRLKGEKKVSSRCRRRAQRRARRLRSKRESEVGNERGLVMNVLFIPLLISDSLIAETSGVEVPEPYMYPKWHDRSGIESSIMSVAL